MLNIVLFSGGSGNENFIKAIVEKIANGHSYKLNIIINGFDDGKSTGLVRSKFDFLGPSDIRKNHIALLNPKNSCTPALSLLLSYRSVSYQDYKEKVDSIINNKYNSIFYKNTLLSEQISIVKECLIKFEEQKFGRDKINLYENFSIANAIYSGAYLIGGYNLIYELGRIFGCMGEVFFASHENRYLIGVDEHGKIYLSESSIDNAYDAVIKDIYLFKKPLNVLDKLELYKMEKLQSIKKDLLSQERLSTSSDFVCELISNADVIVYGSGTLSTSLLPTYKIKNISRSIVENQHAIKFIITNIAKEYKNNWITVSQIVDSTLLYLNQTATNSVINKAIINVPSLKIVNDKYIIDDSVVNSTNEIIFLKNNLQENLESLTHNGPMLLNIITDNLT